MGSATTRSAPSSRTWPSTSGRLRTRPLAREEHCCRSSTATRRSAPSSAARRPSTARPCPSSRTRSPTRASSPRRAGSLWSRTARARSRHSPTARAKRRMTCLSRSSVTGRWSRSGSGKRSSRAPSWERPLRRSEALALHPACRVLERKAALPCSSLSQSGSAHKAPCQQLGRSASEAAARRLRVDVVARMPCGRGEGHLCRPAALLSGLPPQVRRGVSTECSTSTIALKVCRGTDQSPHSDQQLPSSKLKLPIVMIYN
mmetsp:Transcript_7893/g.20223  ORF Transcript_7893/g.20223 Transcript_7893/m.20223 type:complete len:259 (+) Transcript_7893:1122-1898(+)